MKKIKLLYLLPLVLSACSGTSKYSINVITNFEQTLNNESEFKYINLSATEVIDMLKTSQTFPLYIHSRSCTICEDFSRVLDKYIDYTNALFYKYESMNEPNMVLMNEYPEIFEGNLVTPTLLLFKDGMLTYNFNRNKMTAYNAFKPVAKQHIVKSNISTLVKEDSFNKYIEENPDFYCYIYEPNNYNYLELRANLFNKSIKTNKKLLLLNRSFLDFENEYDSILAQGFVYENGQKKSTAIYTTDSAEILNQITSYFGE